MGSLRNDWKTVFEWKDGQTEEKRVERPILFNTEMVRAILDGRKTQTRRLVKTTDGVPLHSYSDDSAKRFLSHGDSCSVKKAPCEKGDILWVRETWSEMPYGFVYRADDLNPEGWDSGDRWYPSIHMPKEAARIFLRVKNVRVERLQGITAADIRSEGLTSMCAFVGDMEIALPEWRNLWNSTIKKADLPLYGWNANPWVWVIEFERCEPPKEKT